MTSRIGRDEAPERRAAAARGSVRIPGEAPPPLSTERLILRPFTAADAPLVQRLAGAREVADTTLHIPHPYQDGMAEAWIGSHREAFASGRSVTYAIVRRRPFGLIGAIGLVLDRLHRRAEMGYWIGVPFWGHGYCSEAAAALLRHGFETLKLHRIHAAHFTRNPASGRVMQKVGMTHEGRFRQHIRKGRAFEDLEVYGILAREWRAARRPAPGAPIRRTPHRKVWRVRPGGRIA